MAEPTDIAGVPVLEGSEFVVEFRGEGSEEADIVTFGGEVSFCSKRTGVESLVVLLRKGWLKEHWRLSLAHICELCAVT